MDICSTFNPTRLLVIDNQNYWVRGLTLGDFALIIAWLDDMLPGYEERKLPPQFLSDESRQLLDTPLGKCVLAYAGLRHSGLTWEDAQQVALTANSSAWYRLLSILFRRRRNLKSTGDGEDLGEGWFGPMVATLCVDVGYRIEDIANLTLDQVECISNDGIKDEQPGLLSVDEVQAMWEESMKAKEAADA